MEYNLDIKVITELAMGTEYNYSLLHNLIPKQMIETTLTISPNN